MLIAKSLLRDLGCAFGPYGTNCIITKWSVFSNPITYISMYKSMFVTVWHECQYTTKLHVYVSNRMILMVWREWQHMFPYSIHTKYQTWLPGTGKKSNKSTVVIQKPYQSQPAVHMCSGCLAYSALGQESIKTGEGGGRACNCTSRLWSGRNGKLMPKYTFHSNCEVFKWVAS